MAWLDQIPLALLIVLSLTLGLAPFYPEPHLWEKLKMLAQGTLTRPLDIFDFIFHASAPIVLILKVLRMATTGTLDNGPH